MPQTRPNTMFQAIQGIVQKNPVSPAEELLTFFEENKFILDKVELKRERKFNNPSEYVFNNRYAYFYNKNEEALLVHLSHWTDQYRSLEHEQYSITVNDYANMEQLTSYYHGPDQQQIHCSNIEARKVRDSIKDWNSMYGFNLKPL